MKLIAQVRWVLLVSIFLALTARMFALNFNENLDQNANCGGTEVCLLRLDDDNQSSEISCNCNVSSTQCWWTNFTHPENIISNGTTESVLTLQKNDYGQYICYRDNSTIVMNILILPEGW